MFLKNRRNCKCICPDYNNGLWDICNCECECKGHRVNFCPSNEEIERQKKFIEIAIRKKKEKQEREEKSKLEDDLIW